MEIIRKATIKDSYDITKVVTISWNETYKGIVPNDFLEELKHNEDERNEIFINTFKNQHLVLEINNKVVGFVYYDKCNDKELDNCGEIVALYIMNKYKGLGYGRKLVNEAVKELKNMGFDKMIISCLKGNPSNGFYEHIGGKYLKDCIFERLNLKENVYYYEI